ncbi:MAG: hypothetical protein RR450_04560 [Oscillospiraceae bacterium]
MKQETTQTSSLSAVHTSQILAKHHFDPNRLVGILVDLQSLVPLNCIAPETVQLIGKKLGLQERQIYDTLASFAAF